MTEDDVRRALQDVKTMQAAQGEAIEALHRKLDLLLGRRDETVTRVETLSDRLSGAESGWVNSFRDQAQRIVALEARLTALEAR